MNLEPDRRTMERLGREALDLAIDYISGLDDAPASDPDLDPALMAALAAPPPAGGSEWSALLDLVRSAAAKGFTTAGPGYLAFIPGGGLFVAALADLIADAINKFVNIAAPAPALVQLESSVLRWLADLFGLGPRAGGIFTSGGSLSNFSAVVTARAALLPPAFPTGALYTSAQAHHSVAKAARLAGFPTEAVRTVPCGADQRIDVEGLRRQILDDRAAGWRPFLVVANAGTTNTGTVDALPRIAAVAAEEHLWLHVDAAYGGFFQLTERGRARLSGIELADSITLDPHKGLFLPYGTGVLLVRETAALSAAHGDHSASYLQDLRVGHPLPDFSQLSPELSRDVRGLRVWLPLHLHGVDAFRAALDEKLDLALQAYDALVAEPAIEVLGRPDLSIVAFRVRGGDDDANRRLLDAVNATRRVLLSSTTVDGRLTLRLCVLSHRTHTARLREALAIITAAARRLDLRQDDGRS